MPILLVHGWPSIVEFIRLIEPLVDPVSHGGRAEEDAFDVVLPSPSRLGFHGGAQEGWEWAPGPDVHGAHGRARIQRWVAQGGDTERTFCLILVSIPEGGRMRNLLFTFPSAC